MNHKIIHIDPFGDLTDYSKLPKADIIFITHEHRDHLDLKAIDYIRKEKTAFIISKICLAKIGEGIVMSNGEVKEIRSLRIEAQLHEYSYNQNISKHFYKNFSTKYHIS